MLRNTPSRYGLVSKSLHWLLFLLIAAMLASGLLELMIQFEGHPIDVFGFAQIPLLVTRNKPVGHFFEELHEAGWMVLAALIALHIAAALYHHYLRRDDVLRRMTTG